MQIKRQDNFFVRVCLEIRINEQKINHQPNFSRIIFIHFQLHNYVRLTKGLLYEC